MCAPPSKLTCCDLCVKYTECKQESASSCAPGTSRSWLCEACYSLPGQEYKVAKERKILEDAFWKRYRKERETENDKDKNDLLLWKRNLTDLLCREAADQVTTYMENPEQIKAYGEFTGVLLKAVNEFNKH